MNITEDFFTAWKQCPDKLALQVPIMRDQECLGTEQLTYAAFAQRVLRVQESIKPYNLKLGDRVLILSRIKLNIYPVLTALLALGLVPVLIDRGMGMGKIKSAMTQTQVKLIIGEHHLLRWCWLFRSLWGVRKLSMDSSGLTYSAIAWHSPNQTKQPQLVQVDENATGLITFTSGSTGQPKAANRTHYNLLMQHRAIKQHWTHDDDSIDCPCFPVLVLHNLSCAITTIMPKVNLAAPKQVNASVVLNQIQSECVTHVSGAPAYFEALVDSADKQSIALDKVQKISIGGSTVSHSLIVKMTRVFPNADIKIVYGSTEAEPISAISAHELLNHTETHAGFLVGHVLPPAQVIISTPSQAFANETELLQQRYAQHTIGEIWVCGPHVIKDYLFNAQATQETKLPCANGSVWHRTGDIGFFDQYQRIWLLGRAADALNIGNQTLWPYPIEQRIEAIPSVTRCAAILWHNQLLLAIQTSDVLSEQDLITALQPFKTNHTLWLTMPNLPVDGRHNSKIDRPKLKTLLSKHKNIPHLHIPQKA